MIDITTLVITYGVISGFSTVALISACALSGKTNNINKLIVRAARPKHHRGALL